MQTERAGALSDGIFAIAATLLVLEIRRPDPAEMDLWAALAHEWPAYVGYVVSFSTLGSVWVNHHALLAALARTDRTVFFLNLLLLMIVGFVPFPTGFLADAYRAGVGQQVATLVYGGTKLAMATSFALIWSYVASRAGALLEPDVGDIRRRMARSWAGPALYGVALAVGFVAPGVALALFALIALSFVHPGGGAVS